MILGIIVQNSFPITQVGTATGAHNSFLQIGAYIGSAIVGTLFASRLVNLLTEGSGTTGVGSGGAMDSNSLTPAIVAQLPQDLKDIMVSSYDEALAPVYLCIVPAMVVGFVLMLFIKEKPLGVGDQLHAEEPLLVSVKSE